MKAEKTAPHEQGAEKIKRLINSEFGNRNIIAITYADDNDVHTRQELHEAREKFHKRVRRKETERADQGI